VRNEDALHLRFASRAPFYVVKVKNIVRYSFWYLGFFVSENVGLAVKLITVTVSFGSRDINKNRCYGSHFVKSKTAAMHISKQLVF